MTRHDFAHLKKKQDIWGKDINLLLLILKFKIKVQEFLFKYEENNVCQIVCCVHYAQCRNMQKSAKKNMQKSLLSRYWQKIPYFNLQLLFTKQQIDVTHCRLGQSCFIVFSTRYKVKVHTKMILRETQIKWQSTAEFPQVVNCQLNQLNFIGI